MLTHQVDAVAPVKRRLRPHKCQCTVSRVRVPVIAVGVVEAAPPHAKKAREPFLGEHQMSGETLQGEVKADQRFVLEPCRQSKQILSPRYER